MPLDHSSIPVFPAAPARLLRLAPLAPLSLLLTQFTRRIAQQQPGLFRRLGQYGSARFVIDPTDLPLAILLEPRNGDPKVSVQRAPTADARIAGPLAALLGLVHGAYDGDALFFSRDLVIEGDTEAVLALRNAIDDAELDLAGEAQTIAGPLGRYVRQLIELGERTTGMPLTRHEEEGY